MRIVQNLMLAAIAAVVLSSVTGCVSRKSSYVVEEKGHATLRSAFDRKKESSATQWEYARKTQDKGFLRQAEARMQYLYRRWPNSPEAPWAARARADMLFERSEWKNAFKAYQFLVDNYPSRMEAYDAVLERQFEIAVKIMEHRRMRWMFGGYRAPEYAVDYFESIIRNGPQWSRAPEAQLMIGRCNQGADEYELAITAYGVLGYRYPDSRYAEEAAWQQILCLAKLREEFASSPEILDRILTSTTVFLSTYTQSKHKSEIVEMRNALYEVKAGRVFDEASFYEKIPKKPKAALIYFEKMIEEYPKSALVPYAKKRIEELNILLAKPIMARTPEKERARPLPFTKGSVHE